MQTAPWRYHLAYRNIIKLKRRCRKRAYIAELSEGLRAYCSYLAPGEFVNDFNSVGRTRSRRVEKFRSERREQRFFVRFFFFSGD